MPVRPSIRIYPYFIRNRAVKNTEVAGSESGGSCWSSSAVLLILANNTEVYLPSSAH